MKLGKLPARPGAVKLKLATYLPTVKPPTSYGHQSLVSVWGMLGNDQYGDCVWAGAGHETMLWNREASNIVTFTDKSVLSDYSKVTGFNPNDPNTDQGTDMQVAASYRKKTGVLDSQGNRHKVGAYVAISIGNVDELKAAMYLFSAVGLGIRFPKSAMTQFNNGKAWTVVSSSPIEGGHYVPLVGYTSKYVNLITWGKVQKATWGFVKRYMDEGLVYLTTEMLSGDKSIDGFNLSQLQADLSSLK
jgi:hypothetical protein